MNSMSQLFFLTCLILITSTTILLAQEKTNYSQTEFLVKYKTTSSETARKSFRKNIKADHKRTFKNVNIELWGIDEKSSIEKTIRELKKNEIIEYIEPNYIIELDEIIPNDPDFYQLWGLHNTGQQGGLTDADIDAPEAWDVTTSSSSVVVAIVDTGIDWKHEDLVDNIWNNLGEDADGDGQILEWNGSQWQFDSGDINNIDDDGNGYVDDFVGWDFRNNDNNPFDDHSHGTHVAGTVGANGNNNIGMSGVSWDVKLAALKFLSASGSGSTSDAISCIEYAVDNGIPISNNSWGGGSFSNALYDMIEYANQNNHLFIAAAGNNSNNNDDILYYPSSYDLDNIISVASTDRHDNLSYFSNYGIFNVDIGAPGSSIFSTTPNNNYAIKNGTSMATPHIAGAASLVWGLHPDKSHLDIKDAILNSVDVTDALVGKCLSNGRLNLNELLNHFGGNLCRQRDSLTLISLYTETGGPNWTIGWDLNTPIDTWYGIGINENGCVISIELPSNNLIGSIPEDIGDISNLEILDLNGNNINQIISEVGTLIKLKYLDLSDCQLNGIIPSSFWNLVNIEHLDISNNALNGNIPDEISNYIKATHLYFSNNNLDGPLTPQLLSLENLIAFHIDNNNLSGALNGLLGILVNLEQFVIYNNQFSGCYHESLSDFCDVLDPIYNTNEFISDGNNFDTEWEDFCTNENGICQSDLSCSGLDSLVLISLYNSTNGNQWFNKWEIYEPIDQWYGVTLNANGCVEELRLQQNNLSGTIPDDIVNFQNIKVLKLGFNSIGGSIPSDIGQLTSLEEFEVRNNDIMGTIPSSVSDLINLKILRLSVNELTGVIPANLSNLQFLEFLSLSRNNLSGTIPLDVCSLTNLIHLGLYDNELTGEIPDCIENLEELGWIQLNNNKLTGDIPSSIGNMTNLEHIRLHYNNLSGGIPESFSNLTNLRTLYLYVNQLTGSIPASLGSLHNLEEIKIGFNQFSGNLPSQLGNLSKLKYFEFPTNDITGNLPSSYGNISDLIVLNAQKNELTGTIPKEFANLESLNKLTLNFNMMSGCFHEDLSVLCTQIVNGDYSITTSNNFDASWEEFCTTGTGTCLSEPSCAFQDSLSLVSLYNSTDGPNWTNSWNLQDPIDTWLGIETNEEGCVIEIDLTNNNLVGPLPVDLGDMPNLINLELDRNSISGDLPIELGALISLEKLYLYRNDITGNIPTEFGNLSQLISLNIGRNDLTGPIPSSLGFLINLESLTLHTNDLSGEIPSSLGNLNNLRWLQLQSNDLTGSIPDEVSNMSSLEHMVLYSNLLTGNIPEDIGNIASLISLELQNNNLNGPIPPSIGNLSNLWKLNLFNNELVGVIPQSIGGLSSVEWIGLQYNLLTGELPATIGNLNLLKHFNVQNNILVGTIPSSFVNLSTLNYLYLKNNEMTGCFDVALTPLCNQLLNPSSDISDGNIFDALWADFCASGSGSCGPPLTCAESDYLTLVDIFNSLNGLNWTNTWNVNDPMDLWYGVTLNSSGCVTGLDLRDNNLVGEFPGEITSLENLQTLILNQNSIDGQLPFDLGSLSNLKILKLIENNITGNIPSSIGSLSLLEELDLTNNQLEGTIPIQIGNLTNLKILKFISNNLSGSIPSSIGNLQKLVNLSVSSNQLTGNIPTEIGNLSNLQYLYIPFNQLSGSLPETMGQLTSLISLNATENALTGEIPQSLGNLTQLGGLDISINQISGTIPATIGNMTSLQVLSINDNNLTGTLPSSLGNMSSLAYLTFNNNDLFGCYPENVQTLCSQLFLNTNEYTSDGNLFDAPWEDFCTDDSGMCTDGNEISSVNGDMFVTASFTNSNCLQLGSINLNIAGGNSPYAIAWNTGQTTPVIDQLTPGIYSVDIWDNDRLHVNIDIEVEGNYVPVYDNDGNPVDCIDINCPSVIDFGNHQPAGIHQANHAINSAGTITTGNSVSFQAGTKIELYSGFEIRQGATLEVIMEYCQ